ncbi:cation:proton antiporter [Corynebacterium massiliense]|uniref:Monovalent cation/H+ antiporter subunit G n=1 Tax=Corynebacterium massiliense DSM 45435 TaxID=1121364 RepID=A0ABY7U865_9CORY|nr:monovalent cation/H(+) antiporter subunit G [Corynebacterium massiliense]WCZ32784.1 putative monovalent cation/H+ antiporter subunit G [Corynebacterium massiliense DSM 45435]
MQILHIISDFFLILGTLSIATCGAGLLSFRDVYARMSVLSTASGFGITFILLGVFFRDLSWGNAVLILGSIILLLGTSAIGSVLIARAALLRRVAIVDVVYNEADPYFDDPEALARENFMREQKLDELT